MHQPDPVSHAPYSPPGLIVFDLDGTLVDTLDDLTASANRLLASLGRPAITAAIVRPMVGDGVPALVGRILTHAGLPPDDAAAIREFGKDYERNAATSSRMFPQVPETLAGLHADGWLLAVCTNKPQGAARVLLDALGVTPWLAAIGGGDSFATRKPDPAHLLGTIRMAGGTPGRAILVGDHRNDVAAAHGAAIPSIFALWGYGTPAMADGCAARADDITQVPRFARQLLGQGTLTD